MMSIPISTFFVGVNGLSAFFLSYMVAVERTKTRIWHGDTQMAVSKQPNYLENPNRWATLVESYTQKYISPITEEGLLQRQVRAHGNFTEYVPLALLLIISLELIQAPNQLLWLMGVILTLARVIHAWGLVTTYGPSPARAIGFFLTWFVYILGSVACIYYSLLSLLSSTN